MALLLVAVSTTTILILVVLSILFHEGIRRISDLTNTFIVYIASLHRPMGIDLEHGATLTARKNDRRRAL